MLTFLCLKVISSCPCWQLKLTTSVARFPWQKLWTSCVPYEVALEQIWELCCGEGAVQQHLAWDTSRWCRKQQCTSRQGHQTYGGDPDWSHFPNVWIQNCQDRHGGTPKLKVPSAYWKALYVCNLVGPLNFTALLKRHCLSFHVLWSQISPPTVEHKYCCSSLPEWLHQLWRSLGGVELG